MKVLSNISIFFTTVILKIIDQNVDKCRRRKERLAGPPTDGQSFSCPHCGRSFRSRIAVVSYLRTHATQTPSVSKLLLSLFSAFFLSSYLLIVLIFAFEGEILLLLCQQSNDGYDIFTLALVHIPVQYHDKITMMASRYAYTLPIHTHIYHTYTYLQPQQIDTQQIIHTNRFNQTIAEHLEARSVFSNISNCLQH